MALMNLARLDAWDPETGKLNVIVETSKGRRNKFQYDAERGLFKLKTVLPLGESFPFDFGFVPSTRSEDGDPLDVLILMDEAAFAGCLVAARLIGVIEADQAEDGKTVRNDRLIAVADKCHLFRDVHSLKELNENMVDEIEHFFVSYNEMKEKRFKPTGRHGPHRAEKLVKEAMKRFSRSGEGKALPDGAEQGAAKNDGRRHSASAKDNAPSGR